MFHFSEPSDERRDSWCLSNDPFGRIQDRQDYFDMGNLDSGRNLNGRYKVPPSGYVDPCLIADA